MKLFALWVYVTAAQTPIVPLALSALALLRETLSVEPPPGASCHLSAQYAAFAVNGPLPRCQTSRPPFVSKDKRAVSVPSLALVTAALARSAVAIVPS